MSDIFLSFFLSDISIVSKFRDILLKENHSVWWIKDLLPGQIMSHTAESQINQCKVFIIFFSGKEENTGDVYFHLRSLDKRLKKSRSESVHLIPIRVANCDFKLLNCEESLKLDERCIVDIFDDQWNISTKLIIDALKKLLTPTNHRQDDSRLLRIDSKEHNKTSKKLESLPDNLILTQLENGVFDIKNSMISYSDLLLDPSGLENRSDDIKLYIFLTLLHFNYLMEKSPYVPLSAICTLDPKSVRNNLLCNEVTLEDFICYPPPNLKKHKREQLIKRLGLELKRCLSVGVIISKSGVIFDKRNSRQVQEMMLYTLLSPLLKIHRKVGLKKVEVLLWNSGQNHRNLISMAKKLSKSCFNKDCWNVDEMSDTHQFYPLGYSSRLLSWILHANFNNGNETYFNLLKKSMY